MRGNEIILYRGLSGWSAKYEGPHAARILALFGTVEIPTSFTAQAPAQYVLAQITMRNSSCNVRLV